MRKGVIKKEKTRKQKNTKNNNILFCYYFFYGGFRNFIGYIFLIFVFDHLLLIFVVMFVEFVVNINDWNIYAVTAGGVLMKWIFMYF